MSHIPLSDEKTRLIFAGETTKNLREMSSSRQAQALKKLLNVAKSDVPPDEHIYERIGNLDIYAAGGQIRIYTKVVTNIPDGNTEYHVIYVFYIDNTHDYEQSDLATYHHVAQQKVDKLTSLSTVPDVEAYLADVDALSPDDLEDLF